MKRFLIVILFAASFARTADAESLYNRPIYNPDTKTYYELAWLPTIVGKKGQVDFFWEVANRRAQQRVFKGITGQLAKIKSLEISDFLLTTFQPRESAWFGLVYDCRKKRLLWSDGETVPVDGYQNWHLNKWVNASHSDGAELPCNPTAPNPGEHYAYAATMQRPDYFSWTLRAWRKNLYTMFVEYPTDGE